MPGAGLALCILWFLLLKRGFDNYNYWVFSAREIEERYLADAVKTASRGAAFSAGIAVTFQIAGQVETRQLPRVSWLFNAERASYVAMGIFAAVYLVLGLKAWGCL